MSTEPSSGSSAITAAPFGIRLGPVAVELRPFGPLFQLVIGRVVNRQGQPIMVPILQSADHDLENDQDWPDSPPWQMVHRESRPIQDALMAIGSTAMAHYSLAITVQPSSSLKPRAAEMAAAPRMDPKIPATTAVVRFEYACRYREPPGFVGETLQWLIQDETAGSTFRWAALPGTKLSETNTAIRAEALPSPRPAPHTVAYGLELSVEVPTGTGDSGEFLARSPKA